MQLGESTGLGLKMIIPVPPPQTFQQITPNRQPPRLPLADHMKILMQHQVRIAPEFMRGVAKQDPVATGGSARTEVQTGVNGALDNANVRHRLVEDDVQGGCDTRG